MEITHCSVKKTMHILDIAERTVYKYCKLGLLKFTKPAGKRYITRESIQKFLNSRPSGKPDNNSGNATNYPKGGDK